MFNYIKDAIFNAADVTKIAEKVTAAVSGVDEDQIVIKRYGNFTCKDKPETGFGIQNVVVTAGVQGVPGKYTIAGTAPAVVAPDTITAKDILHIEIAVQMDKYLGEYANANWAKFGKKFIVEVNAKDGDLKAALEEAVKSSDAPFDCEQRIFTVDSASVADGVVNAVITMSDPNLFIGKDGVFVGYLDGDTCPSECGMQDFVECDVTVTEADRKVPFATGEWLMENLRVPTYYNRRFGAVGEKNYPIPGQVYDQVTFQYVMDRPGLGGLSAVNQKIQSATTHVIYVPTGQGTVLKGILES